MNLAFVNLLYLQKKNPKHETGYHRLYCLRISDQILILGNGGVKLSRTYQEDKILSGYVMDLQTFDKVLLKAQKSGVITIEKNMITDIESATFEI